MIRILIGDDHALVRIGMRAILGQQTDFDLVCEVENGQAALDTLLTTPVDIALLDIDMPILDGLSVLEKLQARKMSVAVLIVSNFPEERYALRALRLGAKGFIGKDFTPEDLVRAIRQVAQGKRYISANVAEDLWQSIESGDRRHPHESLSQREMQTLEMLASGKSLTDIGAYLCLSPKSISSYRARVLSKLGLSNNAELVQYAIAHKLIPPM